MRKTMAAAVATVALLASGTGASSAAGTHETTGAAGAAEAQVKGHTERKPGSRRHHAGEGDYWLRARGSFAPTDGSGALQAVTYDEELVPAGARIRLSQRIAEGPDAGMMIEMAVDGVREGHTFGVHVHTDPCGADPDASGDHYQNEPGDEPWRANPRNEVWLDFTADRQGGGEARSRQDWIFRPGEANSVVLHEHATETGHHGGMPGEAGDRVACFTVPFTGFQNT